VTLFISQLILRSCAKHAQLVQLFTLGIQCLFIRHNMHLKFGRENVLRLGVWTKNYNLFWKEDNMLTGKQKRFLRAEANQLKPIFQVGKVGVNENMTKQIHEALEKRELIKVNILQNCEVDKNIVAEQLAEGTGAEIVQIIGNIIVLYSESQENKQIQLP